ncbi:HAMP domain-containing protein [Candidatus Parcubacteria bacterium]|jgi:signal transduction histidine kinase|nr:MAG: HAMP domain-containing protein [Candidatus Parcubacteria bacterium]
MKLWFKIVLLNVVIVISLGMLVGMAVRGAVTDAMRAELTREGESIARNLSNRIADSILLDDSYKIQEAIDDVLKTEKDIEYVFVTGKDGHLFAHTFKNGHPSDLMQWNPMDTNKLLSIQLLDTEKGFIRDVGVRVFGGMNPELHIGIREERIRQTLNRIRNLIILLTIVVTTIGSVLSFSLSRLVTKPLYRLMDFIHKLPSEEFGKSIVIKTRDEVGELAETFNKLSYELKLYKERMEESYKQMLRAEKLTALGRLSAGLAHEIRNPLTSIKVLFQTFKDNPALTKEDMEVVLSAAEQMDDLLTRFLRFARSDEFNLTDVYINSIVKHVIKLTEFQLKDRSIGLSLELSKLPPIKADRTMIQQALLNLVLNAIEAMHDGGTLTISSKMENGSAVVGIGDTGSGIPEDIRDKIFDPFFTTKGDGTGLGLSIVYNIASLHNGEISFESNGKGTIFTLKVPISV